MPRAPKSKAVNLEDPQHAAELLAQDAKLGVKVALGEDGKLIHRLSPSVRKALQKAAAGMGAHEADVAPSFRALATAVGLSHTILYKHKKNYPGFPAKRRNGSYSIPDVKAWLANKSQKLGATDEEHAGSMMDRLQADKARLAIKEKQFDLDVKMREYVRTDEVNSHIEAANLTVMRELEKIFCHEMPPRCEGATAVEIRILNRDALNKLLIALPGKIRKALGI